MAKETAAQAGTRDAWRGWLNQHPVYAQEVIYDAIKKAMTEWLDRHGDDLVKEASK